MTATLSRRGFLRTTPILVTTLGGCLTGNDDSDSDPTLTPDAGTLVLSNDDDASHTVTVTVTKTSDDSDGVQGRDETPKTTPVWSREDTFPIDAGEQRREPDYVTEPGAYFVKATLADGTEATEWLGLYEGADGQVGADTLYVDISEQGALSVFGSHSD